jgi:predicted nucleic acid-binding protein
MSADHGKQFYDMTYIRLAIELSCQSCTADERFLKSLGPALAPQVEPLSSLRSLDTTV